MKAWKSVPDETPIDASGLIPKDMRSRAQLNLTEAANIHQAIEKYLTARPTRRQAPFTLSWAYKLHLEMFGQVWTWAGSRRQRDLNIGIPHYQIDTQLQTLLDDLAFWRDKTPMPAAEQAVKLHHRSVLIHPFENGNGRWARLLANIWLRQQKHPIMAWPDQVIGTKSAIRQE
jgi:Fic-DOC domain mobile mystery protein B